MSNEPQNTEWQAKINEVKGNLFEVFHCTQLAKNYADDVMGLLTELGAGINDEQRSRIGSRSREALLTRLSFIQRAVDDAIKVTQKI